MLERKLVRVLSLSLDAITWEAAIARIAYWSARRESRWRRPRPEAQAGGTGGGPGGEGPARAAQAEGQARGLSAAILRLPEPGGRAGLGPQFQTAARGAERPAAAGRANSRV